MNETSTRFNFHDLPTVLLEKILDLLTPTDVVNVLSCSKSIQEALRGSYHLVYDTVQGPRRTIMSDIQTDLDTACESGFPDGFRGTVLWDINEYSASSSVLPNFSLLTRLDCSERLNFKITIHDSYLESDRTSALAISLLSVAQSRKITGPIVFFPNLTSFDIVGVKWYPSMFEMNNVTQIVLEGADTKRIHSISENKTLLPKLSELHIVEKVSEAIECFQVPEILTLNYIQDQPNFDMPYLKHLIISTCPSIQSIKDVELPNLLDLEIIESDVSELINFKASLLRSFTWHCDSFSPIWKDVNLPSLDSIDLELFSFEYFENVNCPNLRFAFIKFYGQPLLDQDTLENYENPYKAFQGAENLVISGFSLQLIEGWNLENLKMLNISDEFDHRLSQRTLFPQLKKLIISHNDTLQQLPLLNAPRVEEIEVIGSFNFISINNVPHDYPYPSLKKLTIDNCALSTITDLYFKHLEQLEIQSDLPDFILTDCIFDELQYLYISAKGNSGSGILMNSKINFQAPKLKHLQLNDMLINDPFSTAPFPHLVVLGMSSRLRSLEIVSSDFLEIADIPGYESLQELKIGTVPNLEGHYPPEQIHPLYTKAKQLEKKKRTQDESDPFSDELHNLGINN